MQAEASGLGVLLESQGPANVVRQLALEHKRHGYCASDVDSCSLQRICKWGGEASEMMADAGRRDLGRQAVVDGESRGAGSVGTMKCK